MTIINSHCYTIAGTVTLITIEYNIPLRVMLSVWSVERLYNELFVSVPGGYKYGDLDIQVGGVSRIGTIKHGLESRRTQTQVGLSWQGPATTVNYRPVLSSERALQNNKPTTV
jgi:hypothetical protein